MHDPLALAKAFVAAENAHDVEAVVALFTDDAEVHSSMHVCTTTEQIRAWQQELAEGAIEIKPNPFEVDGDVVRWTGALAVAYFRNLGLASVTGQWEITARAGKIASLNFALTPDAIATVQAAMQAKPS